MPFESFCKIRLENICENLPPHPPSLQSTQEEALPEELRLLQPTQQQYNIKGTTEQMKRLHHKPILYTWHEDTDCENPIKSLRMWTNTRGKNQFT